MFTISRLSRLTRRIAFGMADFLLLVLAAGALFQIIATSSDEGKYPPPGKMFAINGHELHINCTGSGSPTVLLEAGLGGGSLDWSLVQPEVAKFGRVCSYYRAGFAWSSPGVGRRDAVAITDELHQLLRAAEAASPYVLVGHSIGGIYVQLFAAQHADEVAEVVLVDSSHQDQLERVSGIPAIVPYLFKAAARVGIPRIVNGLAPEPNLNAQTNAERAAMYSHSQSVVAVAD